MPKVVPCSSVAVEEERNANTPKAAITSPKKLMFIVLFPRKSFTKKDSATRNTIAFSLTEESTGRKNRTERKPASGSEKAK